MPDRVRQAVWRRIKEAPGTTDVATIVAEALGRYVDDEEHRIVEGEGSVVVVLNFTHGQSVAVPLKLRDPENVARFSLSSATVGGGRVLVAPREEAVSACRRDGHIVTAVASFPARAPREGRAGSRGGLLPNHWPIGVCCRCGEAVLVAVGNGTDIDVLFATEVAARAVDGRIDPSIEELARLRRCLEERRRQLDDALGKVALASAVIAGRIAKELAG